MSNEIQAINDQNKVTNELLGEYLKTLTSTLNDKERTQFCAVAKAFNLNPFKREIYAVAYETGDKRSFSIIVGYETYLKRAEEFPQYDGYDVEFGRDNNDLYCKCHVYRKDRSHATTSVVWMSEYSTGRNLWQTKPKVMLEKVAICTAFRRAFPSEYGGMPYAPEELSQSTEEALKAQGMTEVKANEPQAKPSWKRLKRRLLAMAAENRTAYDAVKAMFDREGWKDTKAVPDDRHADIERCYEDACCVQAEIVEPTEVKG